MKRQACSKKSLFGSEIVFEFEFSREGVELYFSKIQANMVVKSNVYSFTNSALPSLVRLIQSSVDLGLPVRLDHVGISVVVADLWENHEIPGWVISSLRSRLVRRLCDVQQETSCDSLSREDSAERDIQALETRNQRLSEQLSQAQTQIANQSHSLSEMQADAEKSAEKYTKLRQALANLSFQAGVFSTSLMCLSREGAPSTPIVEKSVDVFAGKKTDKPLPRPKTKIRLLPETLNEAAAELKKKPLVEGVYAVAGTGTLVVTAFRSKWSEDLKAAGLYVYKGHGVPIQMTLL